MTTTAPAAPLAPSLVRTLVPFIAGLAGTWILDQSGVAVDSGFIGAVLTAVIGYVYYVVVRFLEVYGSDRWGYILGFRKSPTYVATVRAEEAAVVAVVAEPGEHRRDDRGAANVHSTRFVLVTATVTLVCIFAVALLVS